MRHFFRCVLAETAQDIRYGVRLLGKNPGFAAITVLTLAIGIGANTALFSVVDAALIRRSPYPESERLALVWLKAPQGAFANLSPADLLEFRAQARSYDKIGGGVEAEFNVSVRGVAERLTGFRATSGFFEALGVAPAMGRTFSREDERPGAPCTAVVSHGAWQRRFGADPSLPGRTLTVDGESCTVVGVLPASFRFFSSPELWTQATLDPAAPREARYLFVAGRLKHAVGFEEARAEVRGFVANLAPAYPQLLKGWSGDVVSLQDYLLGPLSMHRDVLALFGAVVFVLLIACANLANLTMVKALSRGRELAVRVSLGAGRGRLMRQLLTESVMISILGGACGILLAAWLTGLVAKLEFSVGLGISAEPALDWRVLSFTLALAVLTGLVFGAAPAWRASKVNLQRALKDCGASSRGGRSRHFVRGALAAAELALSLTLLAGTGLLIRSLAAQSATDLGFRTENLLTMRLTMPAARYTDAARVRVFNETVLENVRALPGVRSAALAAFLPLEGLALPARFQFASRPVAPAAQPRVALHYVSEGYMETLGVSLRKGRFFNARDNENAPRVAVANEAFVKRYLAGEDPIGQRLILQNSAEAAKAGAQIPWEIAGVVSNVKEGIRIGTDPWLFVPAAQWTRPGGALLVRTRADPERMAQAVSAAVHSVDKDVPVSDIRTMRQIADGLISTPRLHTSLAGAFAAVALMLAALGIYGVMSSSVAQSTHDMGVRMALGAQPDDLVRSTLRRGLAIALGGVAIGLAGSLALTSTLRSLFYGVNPSDPLTYGVVSVILLAVAGFAVWVPARRAARVDPIVALRWE